MAVQSVANNPLGSYPVLVDKNAANADIQVVRIDVGVGSAESRLSGVNGLPVTSPSYALQLDESASPITYVGQAVPGSITSDSVWSIKKIDETSGLVITWADGAASFDQVWDDRASLIYS